METVALRTTPVILLAKTLMIMIASNVLLFIVFLTSSYVEEFSEGKIFSVMEFDTFTFVGISLLECIFLIVIILNWYKEKYTIGSESVAHQHGLFLRKKSIIKLVLIESIKYKESFFGKIFNYGTLELVHQQKTSFTIQSIDSPEYVLDIIDKRLVRK